ncbi:MAG TPA: dienelactone hydrolase family protein [Flavobacteriales bacterium]|nr:dienelactone hydrolase family protein [Flavobacteriales bacterium]
MRRTARYHVLGDPTKARAIWIVLHGYGQLARYFLTKFEGLEEGVAIAAPEALNRFYLDEAHNRVGATWMTREDRENEITDQLGYLDALVKELRGERTDVPIHVLGFSQGVATACRWSLLGKTKMDRMVLWAGSLPPEPTFAELRTAWAHLTVEVVLGSEDPFAGEKESQATTARLEAAGVQYRLHRFTGGHALEPVLLGRLIP